MSISYEIGSALQMAALNHGMKFKNDGDKIFLNDVEVTVLGGIIYAGGEAFKTPQEAAVYVWLMPYLHQERRSLSTARRDMARQVLAILQEGNPNPVNELRDHVDDVKEASKNLQDALNKRVA
jgi:hypothetical protein